ncbi:MAG: YggT family protein [Spirochaetaceae bacterium]|nr:YggT family protein [Spirochaetaceae bacterium]
MFLFKLITTSISIYTLLCLIRIVLTWLPELNYSAFGQFLAKICDPYLNIFRKIRFLQIGFIDFSPVVAIGALSILSSLINQMLFYGRFSVGYLLASIVQVCWTAVSSILTIYNILLLIRLIVALLKKDYSSSLWSNLDRIIYPIQSKITRTIFKNKVISNALGIGITLIACILFQIVGSWLFGFIATLLSYIPF